MAALAELVVTRPEGRRYVEQEHAVFDFLAERWGFRVEPAPTEDCPYDAALHLDGRCLALAEIKVRRPLTLDRIRSEGWLLTALKVDRTIERAARLGCCYAGILALPRHRLLFAEVLWTPKRGRTGEWIRKTLPVKRSILDQQRAPQEVYIVPLRSTPEPFTALPREP